MTATAIDRAAPARARRQPRLAADDAAILAAAAVVGLSGLFLLLPGVDLAVSLLFYRPEAGFFLAGDPLLRALRKSSTLVMLLMLALPLGRWLLRLARRRPAGRSARQALFAALGLAIGPGLVVNGLLKELWGRARPVNVDVFGGDAPFTAAWVVSSACQSNCSFVSG